MARRSRGATLALAAALWAALLSSAGGLRDAESYFAAEAVSADGGASPEPPADPAEQRARVALLFERLVKLLSDKSKIEKKKLSKEFPKFGTVATRIVDRYLADGPNYFGKIEGELEELVEDKDERDKYTKLFTATLGDNGAFESVSAFLVTTDAPRMLIVKPDKKNPSKVEVPRGTVEVKDQLAGSRWEVAAVREAQEEFQLSFSTTPERVVKLAEKTAVPVARPQVGEAHLRQLSAFSAEWLVAKGLPQTEQQHEDAFKALTDLGLVSLLKELAKWFDAKNWGGYLVELPPWQTLEGKLFEKGTLKALPLDKSVDFAISEGLPKGGCDVMGAQVDGIDANTMDFLKSKVSAAP